MSWLLTTIALLLAGPVLAAEPVPYELKAIGITEHLGEQLSLDLEFTNEAGEKVRLQKYFDGKRPVMLALVYYECPMLCNLLFTGINKSLQQLKWTVGQEFQIVTVSIDPKEGPELARMKKATHMETYGRPGAEDGWHFLTGSEAQIKQLASEVGFGYRYDEKEKQFAHAAAITMVSPQGMISRYLYGVQFAARDMKLALLEASEGKVGSIIDRFLMFCYHYDPQGKKYALFATNLMKGAGGFTVLGLGIIMWTISRKKKG